MNIWKAGLVFAVAALFVAVWQHAHYLAGHRENGPLFAAESARSWLCATYWDAGNSSASLIWEMRNWVVSLANRESAIEFLSGLIISIGMPFALVFTFVCFLLGFVQFWGAVDQETWTVIGVVTGTMLFMIVLICIGDDARRRTEKNTTRASSPARQQAE